MEVRLNRPPQKAPKGVAAASVPTVPTPLGHAQRNPSVVCIRQTCPPPAPRPGFKRVNRLLDLKEIKRPSKRPACRKEYTSDVHEVHESSSAHGGASECAAVNT